MPFSIGYMFLSMTKMQADFIIFSGVKIYKNAQSKISTTGSNVFEFFCVPLYIDYCSDLYKKRQVASTYDTHVDNKVWSFCLIFLNYACNTYTHIQTQTNH